MEFSCWVNANLSLIVLVCCMMVSKYVLDSEVVGQILLRNSSEIDQLGFPEAAIAFVCVLAYVLPKSANHISILRFHVGVRSRNIGHICKESEPEFAGTHQC